MPKSRLSAFVSLLLVFLSGALVGAFGHRLYMVSTVTAVRQPTPRLTPEEARKRQIEDVKQKVGLDDRQIAEYNKILDSTTQQFFEMHDKMNAEARAIHDQQVAKVKAILRTDQMPQYDKWLSDREAERKRRQQERDANKKK